MITSKRCTKCHKTKKINNFYVHRDFKEGSGYDNWCRECAKKSSVNLQGLQEYCSKNNRKYNQMLFDSIYESNKEKYKNDIDFNSLSEEKRESFLFEKTVNLYFSRQSSIQWYEYVPSNTNDAKQTIIEYESNDDKISIKKNKDKKIYSEDWQGNYTQSQLDYLESYYLDTCNEFEVKTRNHKDYVRKIAKASLVMDETYNDYLNGVPGSDKRYDKAKSIFDTLSQSAKLSEKTRSNNDVAGLGSLSEIVAKLEQTGFLQKKITYEKDDIDKINEDLRWVLTSVGGEL